MIRLAVWIVILYVLLKTARWAIGSRAGYRQAAPDFRTAALRGEPWIMILAIVLPSSLFFYADWWAHRAATRGLAHAVDCAGQLGPVDRLPNVYGRFRRADLSASAGSNYAMALDWGGRLAIERARIDGLIARRTDAYATSYGNWAKAGARGAIDAQFASLDRCVRDDWPHDGLFRP